MLSVSTTEQKSNNENAQPTLDAPEHYDAKSIAHVVELAIAEFAGIAGNIRLIEACATNALGMMSINDPGRGSMVRIQTVCSELDKLPLAMLAQHLEETVEMLGFCSERVIEAER